MHPLEIAAHWASQTSLAASILIAPALLAALFLRKPIFTPVRHALGLLVIARLLMPFAIPSPLSVFNWFNSPAPPPTMFAEAPQPLSVSDAPKNSPVPRKTIPPPPRNSIPPILWACGVAAILARVSWQHRRIRKSIAAGERISTGPAAEALESALRLAQCHRAIRIYSIAKLKVPALFGIFRPAILLPRELVQTADFARLRLVCLHEIAHLRRYDVLINWLAILAQALHWFNPFVWLTLRRLRTDQELLCDADVMRLLHPDEHRAYGETLLALASPRSFLLSPLIPVSSNFKQLKERIAMIKQFKPATNRLLLFALPPLAAILTIITFTAAAEKKPAPAPVQNQKQTAKDDRSRADRGIEVLVRQVDIENARVAELEHRVDDLRKTLKITYGDEADLNARTGETLKLLDADRIRAEDDYEQFARLLSELKSKDRHKLRDVIPTAYNDSALGGLLDKLTTSEQDLAKLQRLYGPGHEEIQRLVALIKQVNSQIDARIDGILSGLETLVASRKAIVDSLDRKKEEAILADTEGLERARPYFRARLQLETHQRILSSLQTRLVQETVDREFAPR